MLNVTERLSEDGEVDFPYGTSTMYEKCQSCALESKIPSVIAAEEA